MAIGALLSYVSGMTRKRFRHTTRFHDLPAEIVTLIAELSSLYGKVALSLTCRSMHDLLRPIYLRAWIEEPARVPRLDFLWELYWRSRMLDAYICHVCCKLHAFELGDLPYKQHLSSRCIGSTTSNSYTEHYRLEQHHTALAILCSALPGSITQSNQRLATLLARHTVDRPHDSLRRFQAWPAVLQGSFILYTHWTFAREIPFTTSSIETFRLCPHLSYVSDVVTRSNRRPNPLSSAIDIVVTNGVRSCVSACPHCPTDFEVRADDRSLEIRVWQDLGNGNPRDPLWQIQTADDQSDNAWPEAVQYVPGRVARLLKEASSVRNSGLDRPIHIRPGFWLHGGWIIR
jgi:hypothetical protein